MPVMPLISMRSEAISEPIAKMHSYHRMKHANNRAKENSVLMNVPPRAKIFSYNEQYGNHNAYDEKQKAIAEKYKKEKSMENHNVERKAMLEMNTKLQVSPLKSNRLQPTRHRTKNAILTILENGEVCIEFIKRKNGTVSREK